MGACVGNNPNQNKSTKASLVNQVMRIKLTSQQQQVKLGRDLKMQQDLLLQAFAYEPARRSKMNQKAMIGRTVYTRNIILIYKYIEMEAKRLLDGKELLQKWQTFSGLVPSVNTLVYCSVFLPDQNLQKFYMILKEKFPQYKFPVESQIRLELVRHHRKTEEVTFEMQNTYMMEFCMKNNVELSRINEVPHNYRYGAGTVSYSQQL